MKKNNKKGFTLAELLIVIAIIAILIAIAIPAFSASLHSARLQTDHGNIRSAYAIYKTADMLNTIEYVDTSTGKTVTEKPSEQAYYWFNKDGTITKTTNNTCPSTAYECMTKPDTPTECETSIGCSGNTHEVGGHICIKYHKPASGAASWKFYVGKTIT